MSQCCDNYGPWNFPETDRFYHLFAYEVREPHLSFDLPNVDIGIFINKWDVGSFAGLAPVSDTTGLNTLEMPTASQQHKEEYIYKCHKKYVKIHDMALIDDLDDGKTSISIVIDSKVEINW